MRLVISLVKKTTSRKLGSPGSWVKRTKLPGQASFWFLVTKQKILLVGRSELGAHKSADGSAESSLLSFVAVCGTFKALSRSVIIMVNIFSQARLV
jgi:hypothetical protein